MGIRDWFRRTDRKKPIHVGRVTGASSDTQRTLSPFRSRVSDVLQELRRKMEQSEAIDYLKKVNPDVSMAVWNFVRLSNMGHEMHFYESNDKVKRLPKMESDWREFASRINDVSNAGLDGLVDILHQCAFMRGAQGVEVEVATSRKDIVDVHPVVPQTIYWEAEERDGRKVWIPYQQQALKKVSLEPGKANFFWVPTDPDPDDPRGNLILAPVLQAIDFQLQILQDLQAVLHHQGWPRNDIEILLERVMEYMPGEVKGDPVKYKEWLNNLIDEITETMRNMHPDDDYIHYDDTKITIGQGANIARSVDVRAVTEMVDVQALSGSKQMSIFMNRNQGVTETWGSIQFMIFCNGIASIQRGSKRLIEEVARLWLRVNGKQAVPVFIHNKVDWRNEEQRMKVKLMEEQFWAIAQLMKWVDADKAATETVGVEKAVSDTPAENIRVAFSSGGLGGDTNDDSSDDGEGGLRNDNVLPLWRRNV